MAAPVQPSPYRRQGQQGQTGQTDTYGQPRQRFAPVGGTNATGSPLNPTGEPRNPTGAPTGNPTGAPPQPRAPIPGQPAQPTVTSSPAPAPPPAAPQAATPVQTAQNVALAGLTSAANSPDRVALANTTFQNLLQSGQPAYDKSVRDAAANAAKYGRIGAGQTTNELDDLALARQRTLDTTASQLSTDAAGQTLADRLAVAQAGLGQYSAFQGANQAATNEADTAKYQEGSLANTAAANANTLTLGLGQNANTAEANKNTAAYQQGTLGIDQGRLGLDTTTAANQDRIAQARLGLDTTTAQGQLALGNRNADTSQFSAQSSADLAKSSLAQQKDEFGQTFGQQQLNDDRNFALDDRTAAALAALNGTDLTSSGTDANGKPITATNLPASTAPVSKAPTVPALADTDPQVSQAEQAYQSLEGIIAKNGYNNPAGQQALQAEQVQRQRLLQYLTQNNAQLSPTQRKALGIQDDTPGFEQASTTVKYAPVTG